jgi:hypothetical protein
MSHYQAAHPETSRRWTTVLNPASFFSFRRRLPFSVTHMETSAEAPVDSIAVDVSSGLKTDDDRIETGPCPDHLDPKEYQHARRKLKKAVLEHYRGLEMLHNYRVSMMRIVSLELISRQILNIYGFRRVLNKFEKATKVKKYLR